MSTIVITPPRRFSLPKVSELWEERARSCTDSAPGT